MKKAWFSGALAVFLAHLALFGLIVAQARMDGVMPAIVVMLLIVLNIAALGAYITASLAPRWRLPLALTMAPLTAALGTLSNLSFGLFGVRVDLSGFYNDAGFFFMTLGYGAFVSLVGGALGVWIGKRPEAAAAQVAAAPVIVVDTLPEMTISPAPSADLPQIRSD